MPLPPALAAKLAKRGLLKAAGSANEPVEEVIAEDYDDRHELGSVRVSVDMSHDHEPRDDWDESDQLYHETLACPNRSNPFHVCSQYCQERYGYKRFKADPSALPGRERLLQKYPLPAGWMEVGDPETGRYYYWNTQTDEVSWLTPDHPRAVVTLAAEKLKELTGGITNALSDNRRNSRGESDDESTDLDDEDDEIDDDLDDDDRDDRDKERKRRMQSERDRGKDHRRRGGRGGDSLDPMDPAAYSDVPRGSWSTGLETRDSAKTGADTTAAGPLFQQRPYPSPGAVLRMNKRDDRDS